MKVILSTDGAAEGRAARDWCVSHLDSTSSVVAVLGINAVSEFVAGLPMFDLLESIGDIVAQTEREICVPLAAHGVSCRSRVVTTNQTQALTEAAEDEQADLIVIGKVPHGRFSDVIRGETATHLVHRPPCPVLIVPIRSEVETVDAGATSQRRTIW